ncbi:GP88 family protein [Streptomyces sp. PT19]|uniref:GP88 family protein n=1 Tax=Streptomyces sp. PT19 TaxID=3452239 RepID=UPI003F81572D
MATDWLLSQNKRMKKQGIFNWTLPAWVVQLPGTAPDGTTTVRRVNVCPSAGVCVKHCYALGSDSGYIRFPAARARHLRNLRMVLDTPLLWQERMATELRDPRYQPDRKNGKKGYIRIHDAGDFLDDAYTLMWLEIMRGAPEGLTFYAYTKEVSRFRRLVEPNPPANFKYVFSRGGKEDALIDPTRDRDADVFLTLEDLETAGYSSQAASDLLAVYGPPRVGMTVNRHRKGMTASFGDLQRLHDAEAAARRERQQAKARASR